MSKVTGKVEQITIENSRLRVEADEKDSQIDLLNTEMSSIELMLENIQARGLAGSKSCDLAGKCVLYIGGRRGAMCRMCDIVKKMNGKTAIFTQPPMPIKCAGAPQKAMYLSCDIWSKAGKLADIDVSFCNAGPVLFGCAPYVPPLMEYVKKYGIDLDFGHNLIKIDGPKR